MIYAFPPAPVAGRWFVPSIVHQIDENVNGPGDGKVFYYPFRVTRSITVDRMATHIGTLGSAAGGRLHIGIYNDSNGLPGTLVLDSGRLTLVSATELEAAVNATKLLSSGVYWMATAWHRDGVATADLTFSSTIANVAISNFFRLPAAAAATIIQAADTGDGYLTADIGTAFAALPASADLTAVARVNGPPAGAIALRILAGGSGFGPHALASMFTWGSGTDRGVSPNSSSNQSKDINLVFSDGDLIYYPFSVPYAITVKTLGVEVWVQKVGNVNVAIYADDGTGTPTTKLVETGDIDVSTSGDKEVDITDTGLQARKTYWMALIYSGAAAMELRGNARPGASASQDPAHSQLGGATSAEVLEPTGPYVPICKKITGETTTVLADPAKLTGIAFSSDDLPTARFTYVTQ